MLRQHGLEAEVEEFLQGQGPIRCSVLSTVLGEASDGVRHGPGEVASDFVK
jgi:hypothetical protein